MVKGMNIIWGTAMYAALTLATYGGKETTLTQEEVDRLPGGAERAKTSRDVGAYRRSRLKGTKMEQEIQDAFQKKEWVR